MSLFMELNSNFLHSELEKLKKFCIELWNIKVWTRHIWNSQPGCHKKPSAALLFVTHFHKANLGKVFWNFYEGIYFLRSDWWRQQDGASLASFLPQLPPVPLISLLPGLCGSLWLGPSILIGYLSSRSVHTLSQHSWTYSRISSPSHNSVSAQPVLFLISLTSSNAFLNQHPPFALS